MIFDLPIVRAARCAVFIWVWIKIRYHTVIKYMEKGNPRHQWRPCLLTGRYPVIWMIHAKTKNRKMLLDLPINIQIFENNCLYNMYSLAKPHFTIQKPFPSINTINGWVITIIPSHGDVLYGNQDESHIKMLFMLFNNRRTDENNFSMSPLRPGDISQRPFLQ